MACYNPITAFQSMTGGPLHFREHEDDRQLQIACQQCIGCLLENSRQWATRCMHEAKMHKYNCFLTLTYDEKHLPPFNFLRHSDFQLFAKRLRNALSRKGDGAIACDTLNDLATRRYGASPHAPAKTARYYMAGEYGETNGRPHYHACMFGINFNDKEYHTTTPAGYRVYKSKTLDSLWQLGFASIGELTWESAAYAARYQLKKAGQKQGKETEILNLETGEILKRPREYNKMSRNPGIGTPWLDQYFTDVYPRGKVIINAQESLPPRFYDSKAKKKITEAAKWRLLIPPTLDIHMFDNLQYGRHVEAIRHSYDNTPERLRAKEHVAKAKMQFLKRNQSEFK